MKEIEKVTFDKLDAKTLKELPFLLEIISSFGNKVARIFDPIYDDVEQTIQENIREKKFWTIKVHKKNAFYPFTEEEYSNQTKIQKLEIVFGIESRLQAARIIRGKWRNYFVVDFGFYLGQEEARSYFIIGKGEDYPRYGGILKNVNFYKSIQRKVKNYEVEISHPDIENNTEESLTLRCYELNQAKIDAMYKSFKQNALLPILKGLK
jgi:hypothetical protein